MAEKPTAPVLYWVGCAVSYDDRAKKIARATAELLLTGRASTSPFSARKKPCTGDPARRAGNEYLFSMLAEAMRRRCAGTQAQGGDPHDRDRRVRTASIRSRTEYPDFGANFEVVHHTDFLLGLLAEKRLVPNKAVTATRCLPRLLLPRPLQRHLRRSA